MNQKIHIAHLLASNFYGGPEKQLFEHARRISDNMFVPHILTFKESNNSCQLLDKVNRAGISAGEISSLSPFDPRMIFKLCAIIRREKIKLICVHGYKANVVGRFASWFSGVPLIAISRGWTGEAARVRCYEWIDRLFLRFADHIVAVSHGQKDKIIDLGIPQKRLSVIHNAISLAELPVAKAFSLRRQLNLPDDALIVASAGRLSPEKNYAAMIEVAARIVREKSKVYFVIFGEGFLRPDLEKRIESAELSGRFLLPGFRSDLQSVLHDIDIFMLPSFSEGLPNVILEAFAVCKPVVATRVGGVPEVVEHGVSGYLTKPEETRKMSEYVLELINDSELRTTMGKNGNQHIHNKFSFERQTILYEELFLRLLAEYKQITNSESEKGFDDA